MNADSLDLDALEAEFGLGDITDDPTYSGLLDSAAQAFMYDSALLEARKARQQAKVAAGTARAQRKQAVEQKRAMRAQTATAKSQASQERLVAQAVKVEHHHVVGEEQPKADARGGASAEPVALVKSFGQRPAHLVAGAGGEPHVARRLFSAVAEWV